MILVLLLLLLLLFAVFVLANNNMDASASSGAQISDSVTQLVVHNQTGSPVTLTPPFSASTSLDSNTSTSLGLSPNPNPSVSAQRKVSEIVHENDRDKVVIVQTSSETRGLSVLLLLPRRDTRTWLASLPSNTKLSALCIPGTHESAALYGWPISACQSSSSTIAKQLESGIRYLDIRLSVIQPQVEQSQSQSQSQTQTRLIAYHGVASQRIDFDSILEQCYAFLNQNPSETVIMSIKQENDLPNFKQLVLERHVYPNKSRWFLEPRIPTLKECRGKIVMFSRFGRSTEEPGGIHPPIWPDSKRDLFQYTIPSGDQVETQDWYNIGSLGAMDEKLSLIQRLLDSSGQNPDILALNYCNASSFPLALPPFVALGFRENAKVAQFASVRGLNSRLLDLVTNRMLSPREKRGLMAIFALDYFESPQPLVQLLIHANF